MAVTIASPGHLRASPPPPAWIWAVCPAVLFVMVAVASVGPARWALAVNPLAIARQG